MVLRVVNSKDKRKRPKSDQPVRREECVTFPNKRFVMDTKRQAVAAQAATAGMVTPSGSGVLAFRWV
jgi:hypothetical protein